MGSSAILALIDKELARLHEVRAKLIKDGNARTPGTGSHGAAGKKSKRRLSPEGRARIAAAQRKRWAAARKKSKG